MTVVYKDGGIIEDLLGGSYNICYLHCLVVTALQAWSWLQKVVSDWLGGWRDLR